MSRARQIVPFLVATGLLLAPATVVRAQDGTPYVTQQVTTSPEEHRWPALNDSGARVWSQKVGDYWQVFKDGAQVTSDARNHERPVISNNGDLLYFVDATGGGIGYQVLRRGAAGGESIVEMSSRNNATGDHRDAGRFFGIAGNGTSVSSYTFVRGGLGVRRFNVTGLGELTDGFGGRGDFSLYDFPDINSTGAIAYASDERAGTSFVYRASTTFPFTQTALGAGALPRIADGPDPEVVFIRDGVVVSTKGGDVGAGSWADVNSTGAILLERDVDGVPQIFSARRCTVDFARAYSQVDGPWTTDPLGHNPFVNGPDDLPLAACPRPPKDRTIKSIGCLMTSVSMALYQVGVTQLPVGGATVPNDPGSFNRFLKATPDGYACRDISIANAVHRVDAALHPNAAKLRFYDLRGSTFDSQVDEARAKNELDRVLCEERVPVIVWVPSSPDHFVLVTGRRELADGKAVYTLADPGTSAVTSRKLDHYTSFRIVGYIQDPPGDFSDLVITTGEQVELELVDPSGRRTGVVTPGAAPVYDIPRSVYAIQAIGVDDDPLDGSRELGRTLTVAQPMPGEYKLIVHGAQPGSFGVNVSVWTANGTPQPVAAVTGVAMPGAAMPYRLLVDSSDGQAPQVDPEPPPTPVNHAPLADAGAEQTVECAASAGTRVALDGRASSDPDGDPLAYTWRGSFTEGAGVVTGAQAAVTLPLGQSFVSLDVADGRGGAALATTSVTVVDTRAPEVTALSAAPSRLGHPDGQMVPVTISVTARDACDVAPVCRIVAVSSQDPGHHCDGRRTEPDWRVTGTLDVELRNRWSGVGPGRTYTVAVACLDASGNAGQGTVTVAVARE